MFTGITSPWHLLLLFFAILMFFGAKRLPEMGRALGQGMREFKDSISGTEPEEASTVQSALPAGSGTPAARPTVIDRDTIS
jgi:sec-independent protein translocase protein TatA